jgi:hypothetical protein
MLQEDRYSLRLWKHTIDRLYLYSTYRQAGRHDGKRRTASEGRQDGRLNGRQAGNQCRQAGIGIGHYKKAKYFDQATQSLIPPFVFQVVFPSRLVTPNRYIAQTL